MKGRLYFFGAALMASCGLLLISGCESTPGGGGGGSAGSRTGTKLAEGKRIYYTRCTSCHAAEPVNYYTRSEWSSMVAEMQKKAKLTSAEKSSLIAYLHANAADA